jgi:hypothetical protein
VETQLEKKGDSQGLILPKLGGEPTIAFLYTLTSRRKKQLIICLFFF